MKTIMLLGVSGVLILPSQKTTRRFALAKQNAGVNQGMGCMPLGLFFMRFYLMLIFLVTAAGFACARQISWEQLNEQVVLLYKQRNYEQAIKKAQDSLKIAEDTFGANHPSVAQALNNLARIYDSQGRLTEAEVFYGRTIGVIEKALDSSHPDVAASLYNLAGFYDVYTKLALAESYYQRALAIWEANFGPDDPILAQTLNNLAVIYTSENKFFEAEPLYQRALAIIEKSFGRDHPNSVVVLKNMVDFYKKIYREKDAVILEERVREIYSKNK